jgi:hypothetical protein
MLEDGGNNVTDGEGAVDGDGEDEGFGIDITNFDSSFWVKRIVTFMGSIDANIIFCAQRVREEGWMMKLLRVLVINLTCGILNCWVRSSIIKDVIGQFQIR